MTTKSNNDCKIELELQRLEEEYHQSTQSTLESVKNKIRDWLIICYKLHHGINISGTSNLILPSDEIYERMKSLIQFDDTEITIGQIMLMSTIKKFTQVKSVENAIILPKFDGCSIAMRFRLSRQQSNVELNQSTQSSQQSSQQSTLKFVLTQSHTRGIKLNTITHSTKDVTEKIKLLLPSFEWKYEIDSDDHCLLEQHPVEICMRGELVNNYTLLDSNLRNLNAPASEVSGKLNGHMDLFKSNLDKMTMKVYEISKIEFDTSSLTDSTQDDSIYIPSQKMTMNILKNCRVNNRSLLDYEFEFVKSTDDVSMFDLFNKMVDQNDSPIDGIVYCNCDWRYPSDIKQFNSVNYGKYAWKPTNECQVTINKLLTSLGSNGELQFQIQFDETSIGGKKYSHSSVSTSHLRELIKSGLGTGSKCVLEIRNSITPYLNSVSVRSECTFELPTRCPYCNSELESSLLHIVCHNDSCECVKVVHYKKFISNVNRYSHKKLIFLNEKKKQIKTAISEKRLIEIQSKNNNHLDNDIIQEYIPNLLEVFNDLPLNEQLCSLQLGGIRTIDKLIEKYSLTSIDDYVEKCNDSKPIWIFN